MRRLLLSAVLVGLFALPAMAYDCTDNGAPGWFNGTTNDDAGCITQAEYEVKYSIDNLEEAGVFVDNGDGTVTFPSGAVGVIENDPLERPVAATPSLEPDAPTVREVLWSFPATATRLAALVG